MALQPRTQFVGVQRDAVLLSPLPHGLLSPHGSCKLRDQVPGVHRAPWTWLGLWSLTLAGCRASPWEQRAHHAQQQPNIFSEARDF